MVLAKSKTAVGLGNSLMNDRFRSKNSNLHRASASSTTQNPTSTSGEITRRDQTGQTYITPSTRRDADWVKMRSITEQGALDEFLSTAELAGTDFTAEKINAVKIVHSESKNPYLLSKAEERGVRRKQDEKRGRLTVPRRPEWDAGTSKVELERREKAALLEWRRGLAELTEVEDLLLTPFERNLEVWRQLWRVIERSDLVVQIVDARNPLLFRCEDLEVYVRSVGDGKKGNLLLLNKADMMTGEQRRVWAEYLMAKGIQFRFFSAELAREANEVRDDGLSEDGEGAEAEDGVLHEDEVEEEIDLDHDVLAQEAAKFNLQDQHEEDEQWEDEETLEDSDQPPIPLDNTPLTLEEQTRILTTSDLEALFLQHTPTHPPPPNPSDPIDSPCPERKTTIGLIGYPNVGKSTTINALLRSKKVSVSSTPGKTKHFQTIHLSPRVILCDCPGLVFPNFANTKAELVVNGVLPIDQMREYTGPAALVAQRIPQAFLERVYGMKILTRPVEEGGTGIPTGEEVLRAFARARGFWTQGLGQPDESRAARTVLKDFVRGKLLFVHPPPSDPPMDGRKFNRELYEERALEIDAGDGVVDLDADMVPLPVQPGAKGKRLDEAFFAPGQGNGTVVRPFHYKYSEQGSQQSLGQGQGKELSGRKFKTMKALEQDVDPRDLKIGAGKKHFKGRKGLGRDAAAGKVKGRAGQGGDYD